MQIARGEYSEKIQKKNIDDARKQLDQYAQSERVKKSIGNTKLKKVVLVYKGWELVYLEEYNS